MVQRYCAVEAISEAATSSSVGVEMAQSNSRSTKIPASLLQLSRDDDPEPEVPLLVPGFPLLVTEVPLESQVEASLLSSLALILVLRVLR